MYYVVLWFTFIKVAVILAYSGHMSVGVDYNALYGAYSAYLRF